MVRHHHRAEEGGRGGRRRPAHLRLARRLAPSEALRRDLREEHAGASRLPDLVHAAQHHPLGRGLRPPQRLAQGKAFARRGVRPLPGRAVLPINGLAREHGDGAAEPAASPVGRRPRVPVRQGVRPAAQPQLRRDDPAGVAVGRPLAPRRVQRQGLASGVRPVHPAARQEHRLPQSVRQILHLRLRLRPRLRPLLQLRRRPVLQRRARRRDLPRVAHRHGMGTGGAGRRRLGPRHPRAGLHG